MRGSKTKEKDDVEHKVQDLLSHSSALAAALEKKGITMKELMGTPEIQELIIKAEGSSEEETETLVNEFLVKHGFIKGSKKPSKQKDKKPKKKEEPKVKE